MNMRPADSIQSLYLPQSALRQTESHLIPCISTRAQEIPDAADLKHDRNSQGPAERCKGGLSACFQARAVPKIASR